MVMTDDDKKKHPDNDDATSAAESAQKPAVDAAETTAKPAPAEPKKRGVNTVRLATLIVLLLTVALLGWYVVSDRVIPFTSQSRVHASVVPIAAEVSGAVIEVKVADNQFVKAGQELFRIDPSSYQLAIDAAEASLQSARQTTGASTETVNAAGANVEAAEAILKRAEQDAARLRNIKKEDPGAISNRRLESAEATLEVSRAQLKAAEANLEKAIADLGQAGEDNSRILAAQTSLEQAQVNLARAIIVAPADGLVTDVRLAEGNFAAAGSPQLTFVASTDIWIQADFTENNLGNIKPGDEVEIVFDALPGQVYSGRIRSTGFGVNVDTAPLGSLPTVDNNRQWLRQAQRFPVVVEFDLPDSESRLGMRIGAQASVRVYTGNHPFFNRLGRWYMKALSYVTYAY
jgi:multidrug resistance efflux pump